MTTFTTRLARRMAAAILLLALAIALPACGRDTSYANDPRPPVTLDIAATITGDQVRVSPPSFGAGPVTMVVLNQTSASQDVTLETEDDPGGTEPGVIQETGPINPNASAKLQIDLPEGRYQLSVARRGIAPATVEVGPERESASNTLLLP